MATRKYNKWKRTAVEGAVIVVSILLAFAIDAWWQDRSDQVRVKDYLSQIQADTQSNLQRLDDALEIENTQLEAIRKILAGLRSLDPITLESAREWTQIEPGFLWYSDPRLLDGAITALVSTGDINLVQNPGVKAALIRYLGQSEADMNEFYRSVDSFVVIQSDLLSTLEMGRPRGLDPGADSMALELVSSQDDKAVAAIFRLFERNIYRRVWYLEQMITATRKLADQTDS